MATPTELTVEILNGILALVPQVPAVVSLADAAIKIINTGTVSPADEAAIRAQLDDVKAQIDAA